MKIKSFSVLHKAEIVVLLYCIRYAKYIYLNNFITEQNENEKYKISVMNLELTLHISRKPDL